MIFGFLAVSIYMMTSTLIFKFLASKLREQEFINDFATRPNPRQYIGGIFPEPEADDNLNIIVKDSTEVTEEAILKSIRNIAVFENPAKHNPGTLDCVSCHLTNTVREWAFQNHPQLNLKFEYDQVKYQNTNFNLENPSPLQSQTNRLRTTRLL